MPCWSVHANLSPPLHSKPTVGPRGPILTFGGHPDTSESFPGRLSLKLPVTNRPASQTRVCQIEQACGFRCSVCTVPKPHTCIQLLPRTTARPLHHFLLPSMMTIARRLVTAAASSEPVPCAHWFTGVNSFHLQNRAELWRWHLWTPWLRLNNQSHAAPKWKSWGWVQVTDLKTFPLTLLLPGGPTGHHMFLLQQLKVEQGCHPHTHPTPTIPSCPSPPTHSSQLCRKIRSGNLTCHSGKAVVCGLSLWGPGSSELGRCPVIPRRAGWPCGNDSWARGEGADTICRAEERPWIWEGERVNLGRTGTQRLTYGDPCPLAQSWGAASPGHQEFFHTLQRGSSCMENFSDMREGLSASLAGAGCMEKPFLGHEASYGARPRVSLEHWWRGPPSCHCIVCCIPSPMLLQRGRSRWPWQCWFTTR